MWALHQNPFEVAMPVISIIASEYADRHLADTFRKGKEQVKQERQRPEGGGGGLTFNPPKQMINGRDNALCMSMFTFLSVCSRKTHAGTRLHRSDGAQRYNTLVL